MEDVPVGIAIDLHPFEQLRQPIHVKSGGGGEGLYCQRDTLQEICHAAPPCRFVRITSALVHFTPPGVSARPNPRSAARSRTTRSQSASSYERSAASSPDAYRKLLRIC